MIALTSHYLWYSTRATGIVSLFLFSIVMASGIMTATRVGGAALPRFAIAELHRRLTLLAVLFLAIHIVTSVIDSYVNIGIAGVFIPFASPYMTLWVALGAVALDLMLAVTLSSMLRKHISHDLWRAIHWISYLAWPIALIHAIFIGTDMRFGWMVAVIGVNIAMVFLAGIWRLWKNPHPDGALTAIPDRAAPSRTTNNRTPNASQRIAQQRAQQKAPSPPPPTTPSLPSNPTTPIATTRRPRP